MSRISIKHIGSLGSISLDIKRVNVFMGPQASGKSTVAKIVSQALWAEKNYLTLADEYDFYKGLLEFHNMDRNYFLDPRLEIVYESPWCSIRMAYVKGKRLPQTTYRRLGNDAKELYHNTKIEYIPAERNFVASIENIQKYTGRYNNTVNFLADWYAAKRVYQRRKKFVIQLPDLSFTYHYKESEARDILQLGNGAEIDLQFSSSGQQSLLPLLLVVEEVMRGIYSSRKLFSPAEIEHIKRLAPGLEPLIDVLSEIKKRERKPQLEQSLEALWSQIGYIADYGATHLIIEEPEQNLYPSTQRGLLEHLIGYITSETQHTLTLTTHSPFILYALNNCMLAGVVRNSGNKVGHSEVLERQVYVRPQDVGLWLLKDGEICSLQEEGTHLLREDLFAEEFARQHETMFGLLRLMPREDA